MGRVCALLLLLALPVREAAAGGSEATCEADGCSKGISMIQLRGRPSVDINNDWLIVNNKWYSRKRAHDAWLGRVGRTSGIWVRPVMINFRTSAPQEWLEENVKISTTVALSSSQARSIAAAISAELPAAGLTGSAGITSNSTHEASYVLQGLTFDDTFRIKWWFNDGVDEQFKQDYMDMYSISGKPRIVTTVWVMVRGGAEHATSCTGGHLTLKYGGIQGAVGASISGSGCTRSTWTFDPNTIIAYETSYLEMENMVPVPPTGRVKDVAVDWYWTR